MTVVMAEERLAMCWDEAQPLLVKHWREIATHQDIPLSINRAFYERAEADGKLCILTARREGVLVGYAVFFIGPNQHYSTSLQALQDIFYVDPSVRGAMIGARLIHEADRILREKGVQVVFHHVKTRHPILGALLARKGYTAVETIFSKRLDRG